MGALHYSHWEQPSWFKEDTGKVFCSPVQRECQKVLLLLPLVQIQRDNLRCGGVWRLSTIRRNHGSGIYDLWWLSQLATVLWIKDITWSRNWIPQNVAVRPLANSLQREYRLCLCIGSELFNFAKWKYEKLNGKKSSFEALRRELQKNWSVFKSLNSPEASD